MIKNVVADLTFGISALKFVKENVTVKNGVYAGGVAVKPDRKSTRLNSSHRL